MAGGRPSKRNPEIEAKLFKLAAMGLTDKQLAAAVDISEATLNNWKTDTQFLESLNAAKADEDGNVRRSLYQRAMGYKHMDTKMFYDKDLGEVVAHEYVKHYPPDTTACIFWLKNRDPEQWRDKVDHSHSGQVDTSVKIYMPDNDRD